MKLGNDHRVALFLLGVVFTNGVAYAAELPSQSIKKPKEAQQPVHSCNIAGITGVMLANGVCVKMSGFVSTQVTGGPIK
jgi:hypothetical protein